MISKIIPQNIEFEFSDTSTEPARLRWISILDTYIMIFFIGFSRGNEGLVVEWEGGGSIQHIYDGTKSMRSIFIW